MGKRITDFWQELSRGYASDQVFFIMTYWTLTVYCLVRDNKKNRPDTVEEWRTCLLRSCKTLVKYDVKEAAVRLSDRIEWEKLRQDEEVRRILHEYESWLLDTLQSLGCFGETHLQNGLLELMSEVFDFAAVNTGFQTTPRCIREIAGKLFAHNRVGKLAELCCGNGAFGLSVWRELSERWRTTYCGFAAETAGSDINRLLTCLCGICDSEVIPMDCLDIGIKTGAKACDLVLIDVPRGQNKHISVEESGEWVKKTGQKTFFVDWMYLIMALEIMDNKGKGLAVVTPGSLSRKNEATLRGKVVKNDWIEAVITLPVNLYPDTSTGSEMIIFNKNKNAQRRGKILFVDISRYSYRDNRNYCAVSKEGIDLIRQTYEQYCVIPEISNIVPAEKLDGDTWSLKPMRYMDWSEEEKTYPALALQDVARITRGVQLKKEEEEFWGRKGTALLLNIKDIRDSEIHYEEANNISPKSVDWEMKFRIQEDDIIITSKGTNFKLAVVGENPPEAYICGNLTLIRVNQEVYDPYVLFEYLTSEKGMKALESIQSGTTIRILNNTNMAKLKIPAYSMEMMHSVGRQLKYERRQYLRQMKEIAVQYEQERKILLEMIGID